MSLCLQTRQHRLLSRSRMPTCTVRTLGCISTLLFSLFDSFCEYFAQVHSMQFTSAYQVRVCKQHHAGGHLHDMACWREYSVRFVANPQAPCKGTVQEPSCVSRHVCGWGYRRLLPLAFLACAKAFSQPELFVSCLFLLDGKPPCWLLDSSVMPTQPLADLGNVGVHIMTTEQLLSDWETHCS